MQDVAIRLNAILCKYVSNFECTSMHINVNTVSEKHRDANTRGRSVMFVLGDFNEGYFGTAAGKHMAVGGGEAIIFNGLQEH